MELDELKKSWEVLDNRLKKKELIDEQTLSKLIKERTSQTRSSMNKILMYAKATLILGSLALIGLGYYLLTSDQGSREFCIWLFIWIMLCIGMIWDSMGYRYLKSIDVENMPIVTVIKKITAYHRNFIIECFVAAFFFITAFLLQAICIRLFTLNIASIIVFSIIWIAGLVVAIMIIKSLFYNKLKNIKKNLAELRELKQD